jgi:hypothetical protein
LLHDASVAPRDVSGPRYRRKVLETGPFFVSWLSRLRPADGPIAVQFLAQPARFGDRPRDFLTPKRTLACVGALHALHVEGEAVADHAAQSDVAQDVPDAAHYAPDPIHGADMVERAFPRRSIVNQTDVNSVEL